MPRPLSYSELLPLPSPACSFPQLHSLFSPSHTYTHALFRRFLSKTPSRSASSIQLPESGTLYLTHHPLTYYIFPAEGGQRSLRSIWKVRKKPHSLLICKADYKEANKWKILHFHNWLVPSSHQLKLATYCIYYTRVGMPLELANLLAQRPPTANISLFWPQILETCKKSFYSLKHGQAQSVIVSENIVTDLTTHCTAIWNRHFPFTIRRCLFNNCFIKLICIMSLWKWYLPVGISFAELSLKKLATIVRKSQNTITLTSH